MLQAAAAAAAPVPAAAPLGAAPARKGLHALLSAASAPSLRSSGKVDVLAILGTGDGDDDDTFAGAAAAESLYDDTAAAGADETPLPDLLQVSPLPPPPLAAPHCRPSK